MKHKLFLLKTTLFVILTMTTLSAQALAFISDGINYFVTSDETVEVVSRYDDVYYSGSVSIPSKVTYNNVSYMVTSIGYSAFAYCEDLTSVTIGMNVTTINNEAFIGCTNLTSLTIGKSVSYIDDDAFSECSSLKNLTWKATRCEKNGNMPTENIENITIGNGVKLLPESFLAHSKITEVTLPGTVETIRENAFYECDGLTSISIPDNVDSIYNSAFEKCKNLTDLTIGESVTYIANNAFYDCKSLKNLIWNAIHYESNEEFNIYDYYNLEEEEEEYYDDDDEEDLMLYTNGIPTMNIENVTIGYQVEIIPNYFLPLSKISKVIIPNSVSIIGDYAFSACRNLTASGLSFGENVIVIGKHSFELCNNIWSIDIPNSVTTIDSYAFASCNNLRTVRGGSSVTTLGDFAFAFCPNLQKTLPFPNVEFIGSGAYDVYDDYYGFYNDNYVYGLGGLTIPNSVTTIGYRAFSGHFLHGELTWSAKNCVYSFSFTDDYSSEEEFRIYNSPFSYCDCYSVKLIIGAEVESIDDHIFYFSRYYDPQIDTVMCLATVPPIITANCFRRTIYRDAVLTVPVKSLQAYRSADGWKEFINFASFGDTLPGDINGDGEANIADINSLIDAILSGLHDVTYDVNGDGETNIADISKLIDTILCL